jgi:glucokinase
MAVIGLDLGGTKLSGAIFQPDGMVMKKDALSLEKRGGDDVGQLVKEMIVSLLKHATLTGIKINSIGCCVPGIAYAATGRVWAPNIPGWDNYPLLRVIEESINDSNIKTAIDNDRACSILGEIWQGSARGCTDVIFLAVGTGIGAGIMVDGRIIRGINDIAGSIGWLALDKPYKDKYIGLGCFEYHASGEGLARIARELLQEHKNYAGNLRIFQPEKITAHAIFEAYKSNDEIAVVVLKQAVEFWGMCVANLVSLFNPEKIIFGGGIFGPAVMFLNDIMLEAYKWAQPISINQVKLEASSLGGDAGLIGSAYLAIKNK